jgi:hypothetical protein
LPLRRLLVALGVALLVAPTVSATEKTPRFEEAARVRFLIVADTDAQEGAACGLDADNLKAVLEVGLKKQKLDGRYTLDVLRGRDVAPGYVLRYYQDLKVGPNEALVFYYSGHGCYHPTQGHLLTFHQGDLARATLLAAMHKHKPRLAVVLTDCCAVLDDLPGPPGAGPGAVGSPPRGPALDFLSWRRGNPPRPPDYKPPSTSVTAPVQLAHPPRPENYRPPPPITFGPSASNVHASGVVLSTADGPLPLANLVAQADGDVMRDLFYRHTGLVDISGCQRGKAAYATVHWGGGLFTISFLGLHKERAAKFDGNRNGLVEWGEFFPHLQAHCDRAAVALTAGKIRQLPEAIKLAKASPQIAAP